MIIVGTAMLQTPQIRERIKKAREFDRLEHVCLCMLEEERKEGVHASRPKGGATSQRSPRKGREAAGGQIS